MQGFIGGPRVACLKQRLGVEPQRLGTPAGRVGAGKPRRGIGMATGAAIHIARRECGIGALFEGEQDRKSTRLNSSHSQTSYAYFCLQKNAMMPSAPAISISGSVISSARTF